VTRVVADLLTPAEVRTVVRLLRGATFADGRATVGAAVGRIKRNRQAAGDGPGVTEARAIVAAALERSPAVADASYALAFSPVRFSRYDRGMYYGPHVDSPVITSSPRLRADVSVTVWLSSPSAYDGGELVIDADRAPVRLKLPAGAAVVYPATTVHEVTRVRRGSRLVAITWAQSMIADAARRELLDDVTATLRWLRARAPDAPQTLRLAKARANLARMWTRP
jgi:PKHD-type hydroxylase